jgi:hypothetical protein
MLHNSHPVVQHCQHTLQASKEVQLSTTSVTRLPSQTKILEGGTKENLRISKEALFNCVSARFGLRTIEKYIENLDFLFCQSFQNLRLGSINLHQQSGCVSIDNEFNWPDFEYSRMQVPSSSRGCERAICVRYIERRNIGASSLHRTA